MIKFLTEKNYDDNLPTLVVYKVRILTKLFFLNEHTRLPSPQKSPLEENFKNFIDRYKNEFFCENHTFSFLFTQNLTFLCLYNC